MKPIYTNLLPQGRGLEWLTSFILCGFAGTLLLPGETLAGASYSAFRSLGLTDMSIAIPLMVIAFYRLAALYRNGAWRKSPLLRMIGAIFGSGVFMMLAAAYGEPFVTGQAGLSPLVMTFIFLSASDVLAAYRSGADVRFVHQSIPR